MRVGELLNTSWSIKTHHPQLSRLTKVDSRSAIGDWHDSHGGGIKELSSDEATEGDRKIEQTPCDISLCCKGKHYPNIMLADIWVIGRLLGEHTKVPTLPETNIAPENGWLEY